MVDRPDEESVDVPVVVVVDESFARFLRGFFVVTTVTASVLIARFIPPPVCSRIAFIFKLVDSFDSIILFLRSLMSLLLDCCAG